MRMNWQKLIAVQTAEPYMKVLFPIMDTEDARQLSVCMEKYTCLPEEVQCALGYMRCLLESGFEETYSAYGQYCIDILRHQMGHVPLMRLPVRFIGWAGENNEIGPAYEIDRGCFFESDSRLFYTDDDIQGSADAAEELAHEIGQASSGIADARAERLEQLRTMNGDIRTEHWCVSFRTEETELKEVTVNGKPIEPESGRTVFILPKTGEFDCMLGEIVHGDPENAFVLAKHNFCMK